MFICEQCGGVSGKCEKAHKIVTEKRPKEYNNGGKRTVGWEIAKEISVCGKCREDK